MRVLVVSPHLDDAVFSCGQYVATQQDVTIVTMFAGVPSAAQALTEWDQKVGFSSAEESVTNRREEDREAAATLGARFVHLDFPDGQYGEPQDEAAIVAALKQQIRTGNPQTVLGPLGICHPDHILAHRTFLAALEGNLTAYLYEELPYRVWFPEEAVARTAALQVDLEKLPEGPLASKLAAIFAYRSQLRTTSIHPLCVPERYWRMRMRRSRRLAGF